MHPVYRSAAAWSELNSAETVQRTSVSSASVTKEVQKSHQAVAARDATPRPVSSGQRINQVRKFTF